MGGPTKALVMLLLATKLFPFEFAYNHVMDEKITVAIETLCPKVEICNQNASEPMTKPNGELGSSDFISCCFGCSCHKDCHEELNCCFSDDNVTGDVNNETNLSAGRDNMASDGIYVEKTTSMKECTYGRSGTPTAAWNVLEPAYRMVVKAPPGGCITDIPTEINVHKLVDVPATCDLKPLTPWGDLLPVYSKTTNTIYKNSLCAQCHGVYNYEAWTTLLACKKYDIHSDRFISLAEQLDFIQNGDMSKYCHVSFQYNGNSVLKQNRCFVDARADCSDDCIVPDDVSLTSSEIKEVCRSGPYAPVMYRKVVYRNAFCLHCSAATINICIARNDGKDRSFPQTQVYLLDTSFIVGGSKVRDERRTISNPKACLREGTQLDQENCRFVYCPSGQVRKANGQCEVYVKEWGRERFVVPVLLSYVNPDEMPILNMFNNGLVSRVKLAEISSTSNPWPANFGITGLYVGNTPVDPIHAVAVLLDTITGSFETLLTIIRRVMKRRWKLVIGGKKISFKQSYMVIPLSQLNLFHGRWNTTLSDLDKWADIPKWSSMNWARIFRGSSTIIAEPYFITKTMMCNLVSLYEYEYKLFADKTVLVSNLTNRVLFNKEYELVEDELGIIVSRVCIQDTRFEFKSGTNYAFARSASAFPLITLVFQMIYIRLYRHLTH